MFGKSPEEHEARGDAYFLRNASGKAKLEWESALEKLEKDPYSPSGRIDRLREKVHGAKEALASEHRDNGENLIEAGCWDEARELLNLVLELTENESLASEARELIRKVDAAETREGEEEMAEYDYFEPGEEEEEEEVDSDPLHDDEYFTVLVESLPEPRREAYIGYGATFRLGYVALNQGEFETAAEELARAMEENPPDSYIPLELSTAWVNLGRVEEARSLLEEGLVHHPDVFSAHGMLCEIYWEAGEFEAAEAHLAGLPEFIAETTPAFILSGETLVRAGKLAEAERYYRENIEEFGWDETVAANLARIYEAMEKPDSALELYESIMSECTGCGSRVPAEIKRKYADLCFEAGEGGATLLELYLSLTREDPENAADYYRKVSRIYWTLGNEEESRRFRWIADQQDRA